MSFSSIITVASCIFMVSLAFCLIANVGSTMNELQKSAGFSVYLDQELTSEEVNELFHEINRIPHVVSVRFVPPDEGLRIMAEKLGSDVLEGLEKDNPLRRSFNITLDDPKYQDSVIVHLENMIPLGIEKIRSSQAVTGALTTLNRIVGVVGGFFMLLLGLLSVIIIMNTIKMTVGFRKNEISIMRYVGATDWFIRWPFIIEGIVIGVAGSIISLMLCWLLYDRVFAVMFASWINSFPVLTFEASYSIFTVLVPFALVVGLILGVLGSMTSIRKYLRV